MMVCYLLRPGGIARLPDELEERYNKRHAESTDEDIEDSGDVAQRQRRRAESTDEDIEDSSDVAQRQRARLRLHVTTHTSFEFTIVILTFNIQ